MARPAAGWFTVALAAGLALTAGLALIGPVRAADEPPAEAVRQEVARLVPPMWRVEGVTFEASPTGGPASTAPASGDAALVTHFSARVRLTEPTFAIDSRDGDVTFLRPVADAGLEKALTGTVVAVRKDGAWSVKVDVQNADVLDSVGAPAAQLPGRTVVVGSEEARRLRADADALARQRLADEQARRKVEEDLLAQRTAAAKAEAERTAQDHRSMDARVGQINELRAMLLGGDRSARIAAYEAALGGNDTALRHVAVEAALESRDTVLATLALKDWLARKRTIPVQLYATKEDANSEQVLRNLGPLTLEVANFTPASGNLLGKMGAPGYSITMPSAAAGFLAQTELNVSSYGCTLALRLTEHRTLDGVFRCQTLPTLIARVTLD